MKISNVLIAIALCAIPITSIAETVNCDEIKKFKPKGSRKSHASIELQFENIQSFSYSGLMTSGEIGGAYFCDLDVKRGDQGVEWETSGGKTTITIASNREGNSHTIEIVQNGKNFIIKFNVGPSEFCGFGAEFPSTMIKTSSGRCKANY